MDRLEFSNLLSQTQSMMAPSRNPTASHVSSADSCHQSLGPVSNPQLSPRQKFQSHIRTLSDNPQYYHQDASTTPQRPRGLQHVSSLRVQRSESPSPTSAARPSPTWRFSESALKTFSNGPQFITEEREVWGRPSPLRATKSYNGDAYSLRPQEEQRPVLQPSKDPRAIRIFGPSAQSVGVDDRPKTSRGPIPGQSSFPGENEADAVQEEQMSPTRPSKFAEGSMNQRSAGVSSTWNEHGSLISCSGTEASDDDSTPRASPQRSSIDINEFNPAPAAAPTFTQRLFKFGGSKVKVNEITSKHVEDAQPAKKKKGLRKSISMWNVKGDKKKTVPESTSPQKNPAASSHASDLEVLNDRKRRAEEAYAQQFGTKRRKSLTGLVTIPDDQLSEQPPTTTQDRPHARTASNSGRRRLSWSSSITAGTDFEVFDGHSEIDQQKRPSRRELEKENQQLRTMLRQQQEDARLRANTPLSSAPSSRPLPQTPGNNAPTEHPPRRSSARNQKKATTAGIPPVPPKSADRMALGTLSNTKNAPQKKSSLGELKTNAKSTDAHELNSSKRNRRRSSVNVEGFPRAVSMILEEPEEEQKAARKENKHPMKNIPSLNPTPVASSKKTAINETVDVETPKAREQVTMRRENWEWPDDIF